MAGERTAVPREVYEADAAAEVKLLRLLCVLGLLLGAVFSVALPFGLERLYSGNIAGDLKAHLRTETVDWPSVDVLWLYISSGVGAGLSLLLMVGSMGALRLHGWGRSALMLWAVMALLLGLVELFFAARWLLPPWRDQLAQVRGVVDILSNLGGVGLMATLAGPMLLLLRRPAVKAACDQSGIGEGR